MDIDTSVRTRQRFLFTTEKEAFENRQTRIFAVGEFYEHLTIHILGGNLNFVRNDAGGDILHEDWGLILEVKASDNNHSFRIYEEQLNRHLENFPYSCAYCLWGYTNSLRKNNRVRISPTSKIWHRSVLFDYLAEHTKILYVVDASVLDTIRNSGGTILIPRGGELCPVVKINRTILKKLGCTEGLSLLHLNVSNFAILHRELRVSFCGSHLQFLSTFIVPMEIKEKVVHQLSKYEGST